MGFEEGNLTYADFYTIKYPPGNKTEGVTDLSQENDTEPGAETPGKPISPRGWVKILLVLILGTVVMFNLPFDVGAWLDSCAEAGYASAADEPNPLAAHGEGQIGMLMYLIGGALGLVAGCYGIPAIIVQVVVNLIWHKPKEEESAAEIFK